MAGYFTQGRGLAPRPMGSPRLDPGIIPGALAYPSRPKGQEGAPPSKEREEKKEKLTNARKKNCEGPHPPLTGRSPAPPLWGGPCNDRPPLFMHLPFRFIYNVMPLRSLSAPISCPCSARALIRHAGENKTVRGPTLPSPGDRQHLRFAWSVQ